MPFNIKEIPEKIRKKKGLAAGLGILFLILLSLPWSVPAAKEWYEDQKEKPIKVLSETSKVMSVEEAVEKTWKGGTYEALFAYVDSFKDHEAPVISGVSDRVFAIGSTIKYKDGVSAEDNFDGEVRVNVNIDGVDETREGTYTVIYTAVDEAGNEATETAQFTFVVPTDDLHDILYDNGENGFDKAELPILVERVYSQICTDDMDERTRAEQIYFWIWNHVLYFGNAYDSEDLEMEAVAGFHRRGGDCHTFTAMSKALLDRAGIENMVVKKLEMEGEPPHFWLLVNIDGEWYHFDSTPRVEDAVFFLWTDEQMLEFAEQHYRCFYFDLTQYPRTPGEIAQRFLDMFYPGDEE